MSLLQIEGIRAGYGAVEILRGIDLHIEAGELAQFTRPEVRAAGHRIALHRTYRDVAPGELLALVNSFDVLEIAAAERNAAEMLGLGRGGPVLVVDAA